MKRTVLTGGAAVLLTTAVLAGGFLIGTRPLKSLRADNIAAVQVGLYPPDAEFTLARTEIKELIPLLNEVITYQRDDSYRDYAGQAVIFTLTKTDGTQTTVQACNPFIIIDGMGFRTKYAPCEALNRFGNSLLQK